MHIRYHFIIVFAALINMAWAGATTEYSWNQLDQPFQQTIKIPLDGRAILNVNVPAKRLEKSKRLTFRMVLETPFRTQSEIHSDSGFEGFRPTIAVNGSVFFGVYPIRFKYMSGINRSNAYVKIKSKHLHSGLNSLSFDAVKKSDFNFFCSQNRKNCTAIYVHKIWIEQ